MYLDKKATREFRRKIRNAGGTIICWKAYWRCGDKLKSPWRYGVVGPGDIISNRERRPVGQDDGDSTFPGALTQIDRGIHVYRSKSRARTRWKHSDYAVVSVRCQLKDCVGAGDDGDAVFARVHLSKRSYAAALKGASDG